MTLKNGSLFMMSRGAPNANHQVIGFLAQRAQRASITFTDQNTEMEIMKPLLLVGQAINLVGSVTALAVSQNGVIHQRNWDTEGVNISLESKGAKSNGLLGWEVFAYVITSTVITLICSLEVELQWMRGPGNKANFQFQWDDEEDS